MLVPQLPNDRWSLDFVTDQFIDGRRMRALVVFVDCARMPGVVADTSISAWMSANPIAQPSFDRIKPVLEKVDGRLSFRLQGIHGFVVMFVMARTPVRRSNVG